MSLLVALRHRMVLLSFRNERHESHYRWLYTEIKLEFERAKRNVNGLP